MAPARRVQGAPTQAGVGSPPRRRNAEIGRSRLAPKGFGRRAAICFVVATPRSDGHVRRDAAHLAARRSERTSPYLWSGVLRRRSPPERPLTGTPRPLRRSPFPIWRTPSGADREGAHRGATFRGGPGVGTSL